MGSRGLSPGCGKEVMQDGRSSSDIDQPLLRTSAIHPEGEWRCNGKLSSDFNLWYTSSSCRGSDAGWEWESG